MSVRTALSSQDYWHDVLAAGPRMGMTFMIAAARDVPVADVGRVWGPRLAARLAVRGRDGAGVSADLGALGELLSPGELVAHTRLLSADGSHIRAGSTLIATALPRGGVLLQGGWGAGPQGCTRVLRGGMRLLPGHECPGGGAVGKGGPASCQSCMCMAQSPVLPSTPARVRLQ